MFEPLLDKKIIIAGPCALENRTQLVNCVKHLEKIGITYIRACLWKPRTAPGWEGLGFYGLPLLMEEVLSRGITPCTEILTSIHAQMCVDALQLFGNDGSMVVWIGSRNQNHFELKRMAQILKDGPPNLRLMFKNQMWVDKKHWFGLYQHILDTGFPKEKLFTCHRGFNVGYGENPEGWRNIPDFKMSDEIRTNMGIPMLLDPSHIAGARDKVFKIVEQSLKHNFDGYIIEVHDDVSKAKTDAGQQLTFDQLEKLLELINSKVVE